MMLNDSGTHNSSGMDGEGPGQGTYCVYQLIEIMCTCAAAKEILTCIALSEVNLLNIHNLDRNHN